MRVRFLALGESRQHTVSSIQQTRHECESRRVCEPPGPTTSSLLPLGHGTPTHLRWSKPLGYSAAPWRCPGFDLAGAGAPWPWFLSSSTGDLMPTSTSLLKLGLSNIPPPSQKHSPQLAKQPVEGCASHHEKLAKSGHQGVRSSHCQHREPSSCQKSIQNKQTPFWGGKNLAGRERMVTACRWSSDAQRHQ